MAKQHRLAERGPRLIFVQRNLAKPQARPEQDSLEFLERTNSVTLPGLL
jgi:hypothetical protein